MIYIYAYSYGIHLGFFVYIQYTKIEGCLGSKVWNKKFEFQRIKGINAQVYIVLLLNILSIMFHFYAWLLTVWCIGLYITNKCKCSEHLSWVRIRHLLYWNPTKRQGFTVQYCKQSHNFVRGNKYPLLRPKNISESLIGP